MLPVVMLRLALATLALAALVRPAHAGGAFLPPIELELGESAIATPEGDVRATEILVGLSFASIYPRATRWDVSLGWMGAFVDDDEPAPAARIVDEVRPTLTDAHGAFVAVDVRAARGRHWRAWLGGRAELLDAGDTGVLGAVGRGSIELWRPVTAATQGGVVMGTVALTAWMELGARERPDRGLGRVVSAGLGLRMPLVAVGR